MTPEKYNPEHIKALLKLALVETDDDLYSLELVRKTLETLVSIDPDTIEGMFEIKIVELVNTRPENEDCFQYLIGFDTNDLEAQRILDEISKTFKQSDESVPGAYALYFDKDFNHTHIGKVTERRTVISKWGQAAHVYEHLPFLVPYSYGPHIYYYSKPE